jgi:hypothetical protein
MRRIILALAVSSLLAAPALAKSAPLDTGISTKSMFKAGIDRVAPNTTIIDQASVGSFNTAPAPVLQYAVLIRTSADYIGAAGRMYST